MPNALLSVILDPNQGQLIGKRPPTAWNCDEKGNLDMADKMIRIAEEHG